MEKITITNINNKSVIFGGLDDEFILLNIEIGGIPVSINAIKGVNRTGEIYLSNSLGKRQIKVKYAIDAETEEGFKARKKLLAQILNPSLGQVTILGNNCSIKGVIDNTPTYTELSEIYAESTITFLCHYPYWSGKEIKQDLVSWIPNTTFPVNIPSGGIPLGIRDLAKTKIVDNVGDIETGVVFNIKANSDTSNLKFINTSNNKSIEINAVLKANDRVILNTILGEKECKITRANGFVEYANIIGDWDFSLLEGENIVTYSATTGVDTVEIAIKFTPKYQEV